MAVNVLTVKVAVILLPLCALKWYKEIISPFFKLLFRSLNLSRVMNTSKKAKGRGGPRGSGQLKAPDHLDVQHYKAAFTPGEIPGTHFQRLSPPQGTWFCRK